MKFKYALVIDAIPGFKSIYIIMFRLEVASYGGLMFILMTRILLLVCVIARRLQCAFDFK